MLVVQGFLQHLAQREAGDDDADTPDQARQLLGMLQSAQVCTSPLHSTIHHSAALVFWDVDFEAMTISILLTHDLHG